MTNGLGCCIGAKARRPELEEVRQHGSERLAESPAHPAGRHKSVLAEARSGQFTGRDPYNLRQQGDGGVSFSEGRCVVVENRTVDGRSVSSGGMKTRHTFNQS